jgi:hypothetical protein
MLVVGKPRPQIKDRTTGELKTDEATKSVVHNLDVTVMVEDRAETVAVSIPEVGIPKDLAVGTMVVPEQMTAICWEKPNRHGVMVTVRAVKPIAASARQAAA